MTEVVHVQPENVRDDGVQDPEKRKSLKVIGWTALGTVAGSLVTASSYELGSPPPQTAERAMLPFDQWPTIVPTFIEIRRPKSFSEFTDNLPKDILTVLAELTINPDLDSQVDSIQWYQNTKGFDYLNKGTLSELLENFLHDINEGWVEFIERDGGPSMGTISRYFIDKSQTPHLGATEIYVNRNLFDPGENLTGNLSLLCLAFYEYLSRFAHLSALIELRNAKVFSKNVTEEEISQTVHTHFQETFKQGYSNSRSQNFAQLALVNTLVKLTTKQRHLQVKVPGLERHQNWDVYRQYVQAQFGDFNAIIKFVEILSSGANY